jgi:hypothetical protein
MGGVDLADQKRKYYSASRKSKKWWMYLFWFLLDTTINNAFIIKTTSNFPMPKRPMTLYDFKLKLIEQICNQSFRKRSAATEYSCDVNHTHKRQKIEGWKKTCALCRERKIKINSGRNIESSWECITCKICLCKACFDK